MVPAFFGKTTFWASEVGRELETAGVAWFFEQSFPPHSHVFTTQGQPEPLIIILIIAGKNTPATPGASDQRPVLPTRNSHSGGDQWRRDRSARSLVGANCDGTDFLSAGAVDG